MEQVVLITGASSGIGLATAKLFLEKGYFVVAGTRDPETASDLTSWADKQESEKLWILKLDVNDDETVTYALSEIMKRLKRVDVLINNAGFGFAGAVEDFTVDEAKTQFDLLTDLIGGFVNHRFSFRFRGYPCYPIFFNSQFQP